MKKLLNFEKFFESAEAGDLEVINYELPDEVRKTTLKILRDNYDKVKSPTFHSNNGQHVVEFETTPTDFKYIDEEQELSLDLTPGVKKKKKYEVTLEFDSKSSETNNIVYKIKFDEWENEDEDEDLPNEEEDEDLSDEDEDSYYKPDIDDDYDIDNDEDFYKGKEKDIPFNPFKDSINDEDEDEDDEY